MKRFTVFAAVAITLGTWLEAASDDARPTHNVTKGPLSVVVELDGSFECPDNFEAKFRPDVYGGELVIVEIASHGKEVKKGDVLVKFDQAPWQRQVAAAENDLRGAAAGLKAAEEALEFGEKQDALTLQAVRDGLADAEKRWEYWEKIDGPHMLKYHELGLKNWEDNIKDQQEEFDQLMKMYKSEELTSDTKDIVVNRAQRALENAKTYFEMRKQAAARTPEWEHPRQKANMLRDVEQAKLQLAQTESNLANQKVQRETQKVRAKMEYDRQAENFEKLKKDGEKLTIAAPRDGWVFYGQLAGGNWNFNEEMLKTLKAGEKAAAHQVLLTLVPKDGDLAVRVAIPEDKIGTAQNGTDVTVAPVANPQARFRGKVTGAWAIPVGGVYPAWIAVSKPEMKLIPGMKCKVAIQAADLKEAVTVPVSAVGSDGGRTCVWVMESGNAKMVEVSLGVTNGAVFEIKSGLKGGETILLNAVKK